ncbi:MAG: cbb3-type cytochrome oxidase assembly protein CcoS [Thermodesulfobacteriota bacterium]
MYFSAWVILIAFSLWVSLLAFFWGLQSGQFSDQDRARYLPLRDSLPQRMVKDPARLTIEVYVLMSIGVLMVVGLTGSLYLALRG